MRKLRVGVVDLVSKPTNTLWARVMHANLASIMPQVIATWCEREGHEVTFVCYTGFEDLQAELPDDVDLVFIGCFTEVALFGYAVSQLLRSRGAVTVLGGPHARCFPQDALQHFDYVLGFTDRQVIRDVLADCSQHRPLGRYLSAATQPRELPGVRERWKFIEPTVRKAPLLKMVPMIGSLGCPYTCSFCIDATVPYQPLATDVMREDLQFLVTKLKRPYVGWHDPNFGVRFDETLDAIEESAPRGRIRLIAESSLSILTEPHLQRLRDNNFVALLPGIESWHDMGNKSKAGSAKGIAKVERVAEHVNMILRYIPYVQTNFVLGLDVDQGDEPFELTKRFLDLVPGAFPGYSLLSAFGRASPMNEDLRAAGRVLPFPFHFLDNNQAMNVRPKHYDWAEFYDRVIDLTRDSFSWRRIARRARANRKVTAKWMNVVRAVSSEGFGRIRYYREIRRSLDEDPEFRPFFEQETDVLPAFYRRRIESDLGQFYDWLPDGAADHDPDEATQLPVAYGAA